MRRPTAVAEQQAVLDDPSRVRIVRAAPGSGKTWLVAEIIRQELDQWPRDGSGIAALSFTRVGGDEIHKALGYSLGHPHFVGTIDAFLFRYVVRPFLQAARADYAAPRLIPAEWKPDGWTKKPGGGNWQVRGAGGRNAKNYNLFDVCFIGEDHHGPLMAHRNSYGRIEVIRTQDRAVLLGAKRQTWQRIGWISHADAAFLASELLSDPTHGDMIRNAILQRFPFIVVDELQDTGFFLGKSIHKLAEQHQSRCVLVGDPDQAIFEFNGARPDLFDEYEAIDGSSVLPLSGSLRCSSGVIACARHLKYSDGEVRAVGTNTGTPYLVRYQNMVVDTKRIVDELLAKRPGMTLKVVTRWSSEVRDLTGRTAKKIPPLHSPALSHLSDAVAAFRQGRQKWALAQAFAAIDLAVFGNEGVTESELEEKGISQSEWKSVAVKCLLRCVVLPVDVTVYDWQSNAAIIVNEEFQKLNQLCDFQATGLKPGRHKGFDKIVSDLFADSTAGPGIQNVPVETIHGVKGETHDITVFVCPNQNAARCVSAIWWSQEASRHEERRVAYVGLTRSRGDLILCISEECDQRLQDNQPLFVNTCQRRTVDEFIGSLQEPDTMVAGVPAVQAK